MEDLVKLAQLVNAGTAPYANLDIHYKQTTNIDLSMIGNWMPIGMPPAMFLGTYNGNGFTISNLKIIGRSDVRGLFGRVILGVVRNLALTNVNIEGSITVGGVAGMNFGGTIENCYVTGSISGSNAGGIAGGNKWYSSKLLSLSLQFKYFHNTHEFSILLICDTKTSVARKNLLFLRYCMYAKNQIDPVAQVSLL